MTQSEREARAMEKAKAALDVHEFRMHWLSGHYAALVGSITQALLSFDQEREAELALVCDGTRGERCVHQDPNDCDVWRDCPAYQTPILRKVRAELAQARADLEKADPYKHLWAVVDELGLGAGGCPDALILDCVTTLRADLETAQAMNAQLHDDLMACRDGALVRDLRARLEAAEGQYHELLYAVENKCEGESRHQSALRYIQEYERGKNETGQVKQALAGEE